MSAAGKRHDPEMAELEALWRRQDEIRASGKPPAPLNQQWQQELRRVLMKMCDRCERSPEECALLLMAEMLRWMRDEAGYDPDHAANLAAGYAIVFPIYGGFPKEDETEDGGRA